MSELWDVRSSMEIRDKDYMREGNVDMDHLRAQAANRAGDKKRMQDIVFPIVMPQIESALAYQVQIFCSGYPMFQVVSSPAQIDAAVQMNTLMGEQQITGAWPREVALYLRDGLKYNIHAIEVEWKRKKIYKPVTDLTFDPKQAKPETVWWEGNTLRRMDLYNTIWDKRVLPSRVHIDGEFAGYNELMTRIQLKKLFADLPSDYTTNATKAFESATPASNAGRQSYYIPQLNPNALIKWDPKASTNWLSWMMADESHQGIKYNNMYEVATIFARIIPADFKMQIPAKNSVQIWKFIVVNWQILIYAEQLHNAHDYLPIIFGQPLEDGLAYQTKSFGENVSNLQDLSSAMWNALLASKRRQVMDRLVYDPSRISVYDINNTNPVARIPVRPAAYGKPLNEALYQIPFNDQNASELAQTAAQVGEMADIINGQNRV